MNLPLTDAYQELLLNGAPMLDVRAPIEYAAGSFPNTTNVPLTSDRERELIGTCYKQHGRDAAIKLGHELVQGETKAQRVQAWKDFAEAHPDGVLYCFRGGLRSKTAQQWLYEETGIQLPRVDGGYKAMRRFLIEQLDHSLHEFQPIVIGGRTGSGKTRFLHKLPNAIDLEGLAHHRGSAFGQHPDGQPTPIDFENRLSIEVMKKRREGYEQLLFEDEGTYIGSLNLPLSYAHMLKSAPIWLLKVSDEERIAITHQEYVHDALLEHQHFCQNDEQGFVSWSQYLLNALGKIRKRLGGQRYNEVQHKMQDAIQRHRMRGDTEQHKDWIRDLLLYYYDPMYDFQLEKKRDRVLGEKTPEELLALL